MVYTPTPIYDQIVALEREATEMGIRYRGMATWSVMDQIRIQEIWSELSGLWYQRRAEIVATRLARAEDRKPDNTERVNGYGKYRYR
jgi:hypothetical protein